MNYGSVCSGIEAATVAWHQLGWSPIWFSEIEKFPCKVLNHHYPNVPNLGDMTKLNENEIYNNSSIDLLVGGTPCQDYSIAGLRAGLDGKNGQLIYHYFRILCEKRPRWFVWENVPGVFSSNGGRDFLEVLRGFRECGYTIAYRVFDSQYFGVPQRRRRVFVVGHIGEDWRPPAAVLFESESLRRDFTPSRKAGQETARTTEPITCGSGMQGTNIIMATGQANAEIIHGKCRTLTVNHEAPILFSIMPQNSGKDFKGKVSFVTQPLMAGGPAGGNQGGDYIIQPIPFDTTQITSKANGSNPQPGDPCHPITSAGHTASIAFKTILTTVRRLTPLEYDRLQGFPDNYTQLPGSSNSERGSNSARYKATGNSMTVNVMRWIGERIKAVDEIIKSAK